MSASTSAPTRPVNCTRRTISMSPTDSFIQSYIFPIQLFAGSAVIATSLYKLYRSSRNVGRLSLCVLGFVQLAIILFALPRWFGAQESFYTDEGFRHFYFSITIPVHAMLNLASSIDCLLVAVVFAEFCLFARDASARKIFCSLRRQCCVYAVVVVVAVAIGGAAFIQYEITPVPCNAEIMNFKLRPVLSRRTLEVLHAAHFFVIVLLPCVVVAVSAVRLVRSVAYESLPTTLNEAKGLMLEQTSNVVAIRRIRILVIAAAVTFIVSSMLSVVPFMMEMTMYKAFLKRAHFLIPFMNNVVLLSGKIATYALLTAASGALAKNGIVAVY